MLKKIYDKVILEYPRWTLLFFLGMVGFLAYQATKLEIDASAESLILEDDQDLRLTRLIGERYGSPEFLVIAYTPKEDLLSDKTLADLKGLSEALMGIKNVESVISLLDVPLLESPALPVKETVGQIRTLESPGIDKALARKEFLNSPIYRDLLVSPDFKTTALQVNLKEDTIFRELLSRRNTLKQKDKEFKLDTAEQHELQKVEVTFKTHRDAMRIEQHHQIRDIRAVMERYKAHGKLFLGGVAMASDDMITFIKHDLKIFGMGVTIVLMIVLWFIFRQIRWVLIPFLCCFISLVVTSGFLGLFGWEVTVISANFISLQIIITLSGTIHLIVRYRELVLADPHTNQKQLVLDTVSSIDKPSLYCVLTTMAGFGSLVLSDILPVINFGWMMTLGVAFSLIITFLLFPTLLMLLPRTQTNMAFESHFRLTKRLAVLTERHGKMILVSGLILLGLSIVGMTRLFVENSFINYFNKSTEIYRGMTVIDKELGGTTPLEVLVDLKEEETPAPADLTEGSPDNPFSDFETEFEAENKKAQYWFTSQRMAEVERIHDYLDGIPETGKVLSLSTMLKVGRTLNKGVSLDNFQMALLYNDLPERFRKILLSPYVSVENNQVRFSIRIRDSDPLLRRDALIKRIRRELPEKTGIAPERIQVTGLMVLYNNMLQSLFSSQILTLGVVLAAILFMFLLLFRSLKIALIAICPCLISVLSVLGFMGWVKMPLDMMTITIASISVGIAVDDTIHYIHRFQHEFESGGRSYIAIMHLCHGTIGFAMYYTSVVIIMGFSILGLSNFIPSVYFGLLTGVAMLFALAANLTLLPRLLMLIQPFVLESETPS